MEICYVVLDPEFFILVAPNYQTKEQRLQVIKIKSLKNVEALVDSRTDSRNLILAFQEFDPEISSSPTSEPLVLYFQNYSSCQLVFTAINDNKK